MNLLILRKLARLQGSPKYFRGDWICNRCGEVWSSYGIRAGDMTEGEAKKFLRGGGCPSCEIRGT